MEKNIIARIKKILISNSGVAIYIVMFFLLPLIVLVPAVAIDFSAYMAAKTHLQNALDTSAITALNRSTLDYQRADKIIKVIFEDDSSENQFVKKLKEEIDVNLGTDSQIIKENNQYRLQFVPKVYLTAYPTDIVIKTTTRGGDAYTAGDKASNTDTVGFNDNGAYIYGQTYSGSDDTTYKAGDPFSMQKRDTTDSGLTEGKTLNDRYQSDIDIELTLTTSVDLPVYQKISDLFKLGVAKSLFNVPITVKSAIRGVRIKSPNDFTTHGFEQI